MNGSKPRQYSPAAIFYGILLSITVASIAILASVPPVSRDALTHHLFVPKLYLKHGGIVEIPDLIFSYYPMNLDLLYLLPLYFSNDIVPKYIHFAFALLTAGMIYQYLKRRLDIQHALLGALLFLTIPVIVRLSGIVYVDLGLIFFLFASMLALFKWIKTDFTIKPLIISAIFCGLALGTKYNGLVGWFLLTLFIPFIYSRYNSTGKNQGIKAVAHTGVFFCIALMVFSPWMIRNFIWTGNPIYPLYHSVVQRGGEMEPDEINLSCPADAAEDGEATMGICVDSHDAADSTQMNHFQIRRHIYGESGLEILLIPIRIFFQGKDDDPKYFDGRANPFLLLLPILAFFGIRSDYSQIKAEKLMLLFFSALFLLFAFAQTDMRVRYVAPILAPLSVLSMFGLYNMKKILTGSKIRMSAGLSKTIIAVTIFIMIAINGLYIASRFDYVRPVDYLAGNIPRDGYIQKFRPEYASFQYANRHLQESDKILAIFAGNRGYYADVDVVFSISRLQKFARNSTSPEMIFFQLRKDHITHLLINYELFNLYANQYSPHEKKMLNGFFDDYALRIFSRDGYGLLQLRQGQFGETIEFQ
jgi:hypothetical protein